MAFALNGVNANPYQQTKAATQGPDVVAQSGNDPYTSVTSPADLAALVALNHAKGVAAHSGRYPIVGDTGPVGPIMRSADIVTSVAGLAITQVIPALPGAILGLPLGLGLYKVAAHGVSGLPPVLWLVAAVLGTVVVVAALTSVPARIGLRRPVAEMLQTEAA